MGFGAGILSTLKSQISDLKNITSNKLPELKKAASQGKDVFPQLEKLEKMITTTEKTLDVASKTIDVANKSAQEVERTSINLLDSIKEKVHTVTFDNGKEFAKHESIAKNLDAQFFFAHPYASWERGLNENTKSGILQGLLICCTSELNPQFFKTSFKVIKIFIN